MPSGLPLGPTIERLIKTALDVTAGTTTTTPHEPVIVIVDDGTPPAAYNPAPPTWSPYGWVPAPPLPPPAPSGPQLYPIVASTVTYPTGAVAAPPSGNTPDVSSTVSYPTVDSSGAGGGYEDPSEYADWADYEG